MSQIGIWLTRRGSCDWQENWCLVWQFLQIFFSIRVAPESTVAATPESKQGKVEKDFQGGWVEVKPASEQTIREWKKEAKAGSPTSAAPPQEVTPTRQAYMEPPKDTPDKIPKPLAKVQLAADKRMQQKIARIKKAGNPAEEPSTHEAACPAKPKSEDSAPKKAKEKASKKPEKKRDMSQGPMQKAMAKFFSAKRSEGMVYKDIQQAWRKSASRAKIIAKMSPAERKKRRFDH